MHSSIRSLASDVSGTATTGLYDLWLSSMIPAVGPSMVTGVTSISSHSINSERLAEKLMLLSSNESVRVIVKTQT